MNSIFETFWFDVKTVMNTFSWKDALDILLVTYLVYTLINLLTHTRTGLLFKGIIVLAGAYIAASVMELKTIKYLLDYVIKYGLIVMVVIFQPELRSMLERIGRTELGMSFFTSLRNTEEVTDIELESALKYICDAAKSMSDTRTGALIVFERGTPLNEIVDTGTVLDATVSEEFIGNIFYKGAPLHDGAMVVRGSRIAAAGCILPVSHNLEISKEMGTRHRAALGISETSDAVVLVVSEENGFISIAREGEIERNLTRDEALSILREQLLPEKTEESEKKLVIGRRKNG